MNNYIPDTTALEAWLLVEGHRGQVLPQVDPDSTVYWSDSAVCATSFSGGTGTASDPYQIASAKELGFLARAINWGNSRGEYNDASFILTKDIDLAGHLWLPIGIGSIGYDQFGGVFDGNGHSISNMRIELQPGSYHSVGMFTELGDSSMIRNLSLSGSIDDDTSRNEWCDIGGIGGYMYSGGTIDNCHVNMKMTVIDNTGELTMGGIIGNAYGSIVNSSSTVDILIRKNSGLAYVGGLASYAGSDGIHKNCFATGSIRIENTANAKRGEAGGLFSAHEDDRGEKTAENCYASVDIRITGGGEKLTGGLCARTVQHPIMNSYWNQNAVVTPGSGATGIGEGISDDNCCSFTVNGTQQTLATGASLVDTLNDWVNRQENKRYFAWRSASSTRENGGLPLQEPLEASVADDRILDVTSGMPFEKGFRFYFRVHGAGMERKGVYGQYRHRPVSWKVNPSGTWTAAPYEASFDTSGMKLGAHTLTVTYLEEQFDGRSWIPTGNTHTTNTPFKLVDTPQTGDKSPLAEIALLLIVCFMGAVLIGKKLCK